MPTLADLEATIATVPSALVAFSGGVDSSLVAAAAARVLGERALAVTAVSPALATGELDGARTVAAAVGIAHRAISTDELAREGYRRNAADRCYHCKSELYDRLAVLAESEGFAATFSGANVDDLGDWRPGLRAAAEHDVRHPLVEAGFRKRDVRRAAADLHIPSADKPAMPCLASRLPYGTEVDPATLAQIDRAESAIKALGYRDLRVRHLGERGTVELGDDDLARARASATARAAITDAVLAAGYADAQIDDRPLRSGSFTGIRRIPLAVT
jgi:pyridinium-3,5-biscarboxylic acid mononucleotide sulfurtransferase